MERKLKVGDLVYVTNSKVFEGHTQEEINSKYQIIEIYDLGLTDNSGVCGVELYGPFNKYLLTTHDCELASDCECYSTTSNGTQIYTNNKNKFLNTQQNKGDTMSNTVTVSEQERLIKELDKIVEIFKASEGAIRAPFFLTGESGSGKTHIINQLAIKHELEVIEVNAAQLTKEGTAGNSLSKALSPLIQKSKQLTICFVDEFDKLFISGNSNCSLAHETTNGVQNEFLKVLESNKASVYGDYGKYVDTPVNNVLFVFAGAFNGEKDITIDRLRDFGIKTEFLGRVGLVYNTEKLSLESMHKIVDNSDLLFKYLELFKSVNGDDVRNIIKQHISDNYEKNTLGVRMINTLITQYFIKGGKLGSEDAKKISFQKTLTL